MSRHLLARMLTAATSAALVLGALAMPVSAGPVTNIETFIVDDNGVQCPSPDHNSIQDAIDDAGPGDTIIVCPGVYVEALTINQAVTVKAKTRYTATIVAPGSVAPTDGIVAAVVMSVDNAKLVGFKIDIAAGPSFTGVRPSLIACQHFNAGIYVKADVKVRSNRIDATGDFTLSGACGYDYGIVVGQAVTGVRPTGFAETHVRVTFNWVTDFKVGGILVQGSNTSALVRRNTIRYLHAEDAVTPCATACATDSVRPTGGSSAGSQFGIAVQGGAGADIIRNAIKSGPNAVPIPVGPPGIRPTGLEAYTPRLEQGIRLTDLESGESNRVHHNAIWRVGTGIYANTEGGVISYNHLTSSSNGLQVLGLGGEFHHNHAEANGFGAMVQAGGNNLHDNVFEDTLIYDCFDNTTGTGTDGTDNTWTNNIGATDQPDGICQGAP